MKEFNNTIEGFNAYGTFEYMSNNQSFENINIKFELPISEICFKIENIKIALQILTIKTLSGFNNPFDDYNFYINNKLIDKDDLLLLDDDPYRYINSFVEKYKKKI